MPPRPPKTGFVLALYGAMVAVAAAAFALIAQAGRALEAPAPPAGVVPAVRAGGPQGASLLGRVLLALLVVIVLSRALGWLFKRLRQPAVIGEVVAGLVLGPSLLGRVAPGIANAILPDAISAPLGVISQVGVVLFMFLVGLELDTAELRKHSRATIPISHASIVVPFLLGGVGALFLYPRLGVPGVPFVVFALFFGVSMSVTAFPVLARILTDRGLERTPLGVIALACAAIDDVTAWCLLAIVVSVATRSSAVGAFPTLGLTLTYGCAVLLVVRPIIERAARRLDLVPAIGRGAIAAMFIALLGSALVTESIGIHALFGAFLLGAVVPHESRLAKELRAKLEDVVTILLLPAYFAFTGLRTEIGLVSGAGEWAIAMGLILIASLGKIGGTTFAARLVGQDWRSAASLGVLMNTRGLMELIVLNVGLDLGVLSPKLFAMMIVMALVTTFATSPLLELIGARDRAPRNALTSLPP